MVEMDFIQEMKKEIKWPKYQKEMKDNQVGRRPEKKRVLGSAQRILWMLMTSLTTIPKLKMAKMASGGRVLLTLLLLGSQTWKKMTLTGKTTMQLLPSQYLPIVPYFLLEKLANFP